MIIYQLNYATIGERGELIQHHETFFSWWNARLHLWLSRREKHRITYGLIKKQVKP